MYVINGRPLAPNFNLAFIHQITKKNSRELAASNTEEGSFNKFTLTLRLERAGQSLLYISRLARFTGILVSASQHIKYMTLMRQLMYLSISYYDIPPFLQAGINRELNK